MQRCCVPFCAGQKTLRLKTLVRLRMAHLFAAAANVMCAARFTTFERVQLREISLLKRDGKKSRLIAKSLSGPQYCVSKRSVHENDVALAINDMMQQA